MVLLRVGIVVARDWENLLPPKPGPGALMGFGVYKKGQHSSQLSSIDEQYILGLTFGDSAVPEAGALAATRF